MYLQAIGVVFAILGFIATIVVLIVATLRVTSADRVAPYAFPPLEIDPWVRSGGRKLRVTYPDYWAARELHKFALLWQESLRVDPSQRKSVLLPARSILRQIERADAVAGLIWCVQTRFPELNRLAIWLLGRTGGTLGTTAVAEFCRHSDCRMRREVGRALVRMRAWRELQHMATMDSDSQVRRLATPPQKKAFATRFAALTAAGVKPAQQSIAPAPMPLMWNVAPDAGRQPKPAWWLRQVLERIHRLLHGEVRSR